MCQKYGLEKGLFKSYNSLIDFIRGYEPAREVKLSMFSISKLRSRDTITRSVPRTEENESFIKYVKEHFGSFNQDLFFRELDPEFIKGKMKMKKSMTKCKKNDDDDTSSSSSSTSTSNELISINKPETSLIKLE